MGKHLFVLGHGKGPNGAYDPGASGNGTNEDKFLNDEFYPALKSYAPSNVAFYTTKNMFAYEDALRISGYDSVTELHLDWAPGASGGHVIIYKDYNPDKVDLAIRDVVNKYVGLRMSSGISKRDNLFNLNTFAKRGITYRLVELGFINNYSDMKKIRSNLYEYARKLMEAVTGKVIDPMEKGYLKEGDVGGSVKELQRSLVELGYNLKANGSFGDDTAKALKGFQKAHHLDQDELYGPNTQKRLKDALKRYAAVANKEKEETKVDRDINKVSEWAKENWEEATENGYFDGKRPGATLTREEAAIVVNRLRHNFRELIDGNKEEIKRLQSELKAAGVEIPEE